MMNTNKSQKKIVKPGVAENALLAEGRVYVYLRVSTNKQDTDNQKFEVQNFCKRKNITVDKWVEDIMSGTVDVKDRKIQPILNKLKRGDSLIVTEISRLSRNLFHIMEVLQYCLKKEVVIYTVKEGYVLGNDIQSKVMAFAFGIAAEIERNLISQRTKEALARLKSEGRILGRPVGSKKKNPILLKHSDSILRLYKDGVTQATISRTFKVHRHTVKKFLESVE